MSISPSSGNPPYLMTAMFTDRGLIDGVNYVFELYVPSAQATCPIAPVLTSMNQSLADQLLAMGELVVTGNVPVGTCRGMSGVIRRVADDEIVSSSTVYIDNT